MGKGVVGKTSMIYRFITGNKLENMEATIEDNYKTFENIGGENIQINILDTAGEEDYQNLFDSWLRQADGIILVFAIDDKESFEQLNDKYERILKNEKIDEVKYPIVLVGNKCDLEDSRQVSQDDAKKFAKRIGGDYYEISALTDQNNNIKDPFIKCANLVFKEKNKESKKGCPLCCIF
ncbi:MAG: GTP-binding protein [archaeon]|nr:GTP-binding protein [archaeon]